MNNKFAIALLAALASTAALAETAVFREQVLSIDGVGVVTATGAAYYGNVKLQQLTDGSFRLVQAEQHNLAIVDSVDVLNAHSTPAEVSLHVKGVQANACAALLEPVVSRKGNEFAVIIAETMQPPGSVCMSLLAVTPFQLDVPLTVTGLPAGNYRVNVNGKLVQFAL